MNSASRIVAPLLLGLLATNAQAESFRDFWKQRAPISTMVSSKSALSLELCLATEGGESGTPTVVHGERETLVTIMQAGQIISTTIGFRVLDEGGGRKVEIWARGSTLGTWTKRALAAAQACV